MNLIIRISILSLVSILLANMGFSYSYAFLGNDLDELPGIGTFEICNNGLDDDNDGLIDIDDSLDC